MKNLLLILFLSINTLAISQNYQGYVPFPTSAVWVESNGSSTGYCVRNEYRINNQDTLINGMIYYRVDQKNITNSGSCYPRNAQVINSVFGYLRNDSANKKVWLRLPNSNQDTLFYDFDLVVGDTVGNGDFYMSPSYHQIVVDSIDTVYFGSQYRRKVYFTTQCDSRFNYLIEGIGAVTGFAAFKLDSYCPLAGAFYNLECMGDSLVAIYPDSTAGCRLITNLKENEQKLENIQFYPNPTSGIINLSVEKPPQSIKIYNLQGQKVQEINPKERSWELPEQSGLYLIRIQDGDGKVYSKKILKN